MTTSRANSRPNQDNPYLPHMAVIEKIIDETSDVRTFHFNFRDKALKQKFTFEPGQFGEYSILGTGEAPFCISSSPTRKDHLECTVKRTGKVTNALHRLAVGAEIGFRGPYGKGFPIEELKGKNLVFVAGGIGLAPLRSLIFYVLDNRQDFGNLDIVYGARSPSDLVFKYDLADWQKDEAMNLSITVDQGDDKWKGTVGFVPQVLERVAPSPVNATAVVCGPPIMIRFTFPVLEKLGFAPSQMVTTLEKRMKCGIGKCGRCNIGNIYVCKDGPVFNYEQIMNLVSSEY